MPDIWLPWQSDYSLTPDGDLALVDGIDLDNQHIVRRLLTAVNGYLWNSRYGAGLPQKIGRTQLDRVIRAIVLSQIYLEATVARIPAPVIDVQFKADQAGLCSIAITYANAISNVTTAISLEVPTNA